MESTFPSLAIPDISLPDFIKKQIKKFGLDIAVVDHTKRKSYTYEEIYNRINLLSSAFSRLGLKKGDIVGLCANCAEYPVVVLAIMSCGATVTTCRTSFSLDEFVHRFDHTRPRFLVVCNELEQTIKEVAMKLPNVQEVFTINKSSSSRSIDELIDSEEDQEDLIVQDNIDTKDIAAIFYSSGTTGVPKGIMHTHYSLVSFIEIWRSQAKQFRGNCCYNFFPLCSAFGLQNLFSSLFDGVMFVFDDKFEQDQMLSAVEKYKVSQIIGDIELITALAKKRSSRNYDTSSLKQITCSGTTISPYLMDDIAKRFDCLVSPTYGLTEMDPISATHPITYIRASNGMIAPNTMVKICDDSAGLEVKCGQLGNILAKGPQMMKGYFGNPEATFKTIDKDGWLHTGDVGYLNKDGMLYVIGRKRDLIKYKETLIAPAELEKVLLQHPLILEAGVVAVADEAGKAPRAYVVVEDHKLNEEQVKRIVEDKLPKEKHLRGGVAFVNEVPINFAGKIARDVLLESGA